MFFNTLIDALYALTDELRKGRHAMTQASDRAKASADAFVAGVEALLILAATQAKAIRDANAANDPVFNAIADELDAEAGKVQTALTPPASAA